MENIRHTGMAATGNIRVLFQNRSTASSHRGGDTVLMEKLAEGLRARGASVTIDLEGRANPADYDLVHIFNFALPDMVRAYAERAHQAGVPYVVSTLYEDIPSFHNQSVTMANWLVEYTRHGQDRNWARANRPDLSKVEPCAPFANEWSARHAAALFASGASEAAVLKRDYPGLSNVHVATFGYETGIEGTPTDFATQYGIKDFVLCVGRIESRKNQLMLLKALEDSPLTVVLAGGGFSYQPAYEQAVRSFKRKGRTIVLDRVSPEMLASAYAAARVHCLPSWYELPGLVSLEAAWQGCVVVASDTGSTADYLGDGAWYCEPHNPDSIRNAVNAAYFSPAPTSLREQVRGFTWAETVRQTWDVYQHVTGKTAQRPATMPTQAPQASATPAGWQSINIPAEPQIPHSGPNPVSMDFLERGEEAARNKDFEQAHLLLTRAEELNPQSARTFKAHGAVYLAEGNEPRARQYFEKALEVDAREPRAMSGLGMCLMMEKRHEQAYSWFVKALEAGPGHLVTLMQLVECSYLLGRFDDLERYLRHYVTEHPEDSEMLYCHAGALYKLGRKAESMEIAQKVLHANPKHLGAQQLCDIINEQGHAQPQTAQPSAPVWQNTAPAPVTPAAMPDDLDKYITELEDEKRKRNIDAVKQGCQGLLKRSDLRPDQREKLSVLQAEAAVLSQDLVSAKSIYDEVLKANPDSARAICGCGALAAHAGDWNGARALFEKALAVQPNYDVALAGLGLCSTWFNQPETAWGYYEKALAANGENSRALLGIIELGYQLGRLDRVESAIRNYLDMHPADLDFVYSLAGCCFAQGKLREAQEEVSKITIFQPDHEKAIELQSMIASRQAAGQHASV